MRVLLIFAVLAFGLSSFAEAHIVRLRPYWSGPGANGIGWHSNSGVQASSQLSPKVGWSMLKGEPILTRGYLVLNLNQGHLSQYQKFNYGIVSGHIDFWLGYSSPDAAETLNIFDVKSPIASVDPMLTPQGPPTIAPAVFEDLGTGALYGSTSISPSTSNRVTVPLNQAAIRDIWNNRDQLFAMGFSLGSVESSYIADEYLALGVSEVTLQMGPVPEPSSATVLVTGAIGCALFRRRNRPLPAPA